MNQHLSKRKALKEAIPYLERFGLGEYSNKPPYAMSGGMRQRASFVRTILTGKDILLFDEPFGAGAADVFLETERKVFRMSGPEERERAVGLYFTTPMTTAQVGEAPGLSDQAVPGTPVGEGSPVCRSYGGTHHPAGDKGQGDRNRCRAAEAGRRTARRGRRSGPRPGRGVQGGMAALRAGNGNAGQDDKPAPRRSRNAGAVCDDAEASRRGVEESGPENALMREVSEVAEKDPGADPRRLSNREKTLPADRLRPACSPGSMTCLPGIAPGGHHCRHAGLSVDGYAGLGTEAEEAFAASKGRYGYRGIRAMLGTGVSEKAVRGIMAEGDPTAHVPRRRRYGSHEGETTPAPGNLADRDFTAKSPNEKRPADITRDQGRGREGRASRRRSTAMTAGSSRAPPVPVPTPGSPTGCPSRPRRRCRRGRGPWCIPTAACHCRWPGWPDLMERHGLIWSTGAKGRSPDNAAAEGFFGRMKTESVHPGHWEERPRGEVLALVGDCIRWHDHGRIKRSLGWMSPVQYRQS